MKSEIINKLRKRIPLKIRLNTSNEVAMIDLLAKLGIRDGCWKEEENEMLEKLCNCAKELTEWQLDNIKKWESDGKP